MAGFLAASLFKNDAGKNSPFETRFLCLSLISLMIEHYSYIIDGTEDFISIDLDSRDDVEVGREDIEDNTHSKEVMKTKGGVQHHEEEGQQENHSVQGMKSMTSCSSLQSSNYQTPAFFTPTGGGSTENLACLAVVDENESVQDESELAEEVVVAVDEMLVAYEQHNPFTATSLQEVEPSKLDEFLTGPLGEAITVVEQGFAGGQVFRESDTELGEGIVMDLIHEVVEKVMEGLETSRDKQMCHKQELRDVSLASTDTLFADSNWGE
ncbi:hypothetical protein BDR26DRAFT_589536 [Obelidium mucronatum]|nr:hypothetical protein BDR26DRAFT_589536 [Obelidium mucronatum]